MPNDKNIITVYGSGCPTCKKLLELVKKAVAELKLEAEVGYITDLQKIMALNVMSMPALTVNGKVVMTGLMPSKEKIKKLISDNL